MHNKTSLKIILVIIFVLIFVGIILGLIIVLTRLGGGNNISCKGIGSDCTSNSVCCTNYCNSAKKCACLQNRKSCKSASDCCSNYCNSANTCACMPATHQSCIYGYCCGEAECMKVEEDGKKVTACYIPENRVCWADSDCYTGLCFNSKCEKKQNY